MKGVLLYRDFLLAGQIVAEGTGEAYLLRDPSVVIDSREVRGGEVFVALPGERTDGHRYVGEVFEKGAAWAVVSRAWFDRYGAEYSSQSRRFLVADDTLVALQQLALSYRKGFSVPVVAVGGSNGKTSTKELIASVLSVGYSVHMSQGNRNNHIGVPLTLLQMRHETGIAVIEMGINHPGEMSLLAELAQPTHGLLTNIGHEHLEFFKDLDGVAAAETELFSHLQMHGGMAFVNADDPRLETAGKELDRRIFYGTRDDGRNCLWAERIVLDRVGRVSFSLCSSDGRVPVSLDFIGRHNIINALAAASVGVHFGLSVTSIKSGLESLHPPAGWKRMELLERGGIVILNDTYNANPDSVRYALDTLASLPSASRKIAVLGDMLELGRTSAEEHEKIGRYLQKIPIDAVCTFGDMSRLCCRHAGKRCLGHFEDMESLTDVLAGMIQDGDAVLFKASRGMRLEDAAAALMKARTKEGS
jgi:UDP-N-acetylmuramoyl-tripeptide--D-alanyl-D-alanine ligase